VGPAGNPTTCSAIADVLRLAEYHRVTRRPKTHVPGLPPNDGIARLSPDDRKGSGISGQGNGDDGKVSLRRETICGILGANLGGRPDRGPSECDAASAGSLARQCKACGSGDASVIRALAQPLRLQPRR
jgi:hypothetical protein